MIANNSQLLAHLEHYSANWDQRALAAGAWVAVLCTSFVPEPFCPPQESLNYTLMLDVLNHDPSDLPKEVIGFEMAA
jgi:hypothetical protein